MTIIMQSQYRNDWQVGREETLMYDYTQYVTCMKNYLWRNQNWNKRYGHLVWRRKFNANESGNAPTAQIQRTQPPSITKRRKNKCR